MVGFYGRDGLSLLRFGGCEGRFRLSRRWGQRIRGAVITMTPVYCLLTMVPKIASNNTISIGTYA